MYDLLITGGRIVDGTGRPWFRADIGVGGDTITAIGRLRGSQARHTIAADDLVVCPGFIDMHIHSEIYLLAEPAAEERIRQGVTTDVVGQCGMSYAPASPRSMDFWRDYLASASGTADLDYGWSSVGEFLDRFDRGVGINVAYLAPHGNVRMEVMGLEQRTPTPDELTRMKELVAQAMREGAFGMSTGLMYKPSMYGETAELSALSRVVAEYGGLYVTHMRQYVEGIEASFEEVCAISRQSGASAHISHFNTTAEVGATLMDRARSEGLDITYDLYPYNAGYTILGANMSNWVHEGTAEESIERLRQPENRARLCAEFDAGGGLKRGRTDRVYLADLAQPHNKAYRGKSLKDAAALAGKPMGEFVADLLIEEHFNVGIIAEHVHRTEGDIEGLLQRREQMVGSDGIMIGEFLHPRGFGAFPRILGVYVRERGALQLEDAIRKMTWASAGRLGLSDRGLLREGWKADIACFDADRVIDRATYSESRLPPAGIPYVIVNGTLVIDAEQPTGALPGRALRHRERV
jgi:N-acyl-D-amino-acid deacylase